MQIVRTSEPHPVRFVKHTVLLMSILWIVRDVARFAWKTLR